MHSISRSSGCSWAFSFSWSTCVASCSSSQIDTKGLHHYFEKQVKPRLSLVLEQNWPEGWNLTDLDRWDCWFQHSGDVSVQMLLEKPLASKAWRLNTGSKGWLLSLWSRKGKRWKESRNAFRTETNSDSAKSSATCDLRASQAARYPHVTRCKNSWGDNERCATAGL